MKNAQIIPIFFAVDDNYAPLTVVAIESIMCNASKEYNYNIHILHENLSAENQKILASRARDNFKVLLTDMTQHIATHADKMHLRDYYTKTIYFRVYIADMFPEYKKAIYFDSDIIVNADVSEFFNFELGDNYLGAITCETVDTYEVFTKYAENYLGLKLPWYFNSGILLLNCEVLRKVKFEKKFFDIAKKVILKVAPDQDYFNVLCHGRTLFLPRVWNKIPLPVEGVTQENVKLVHYNLSFRPWRYDNVLFGELFWKHAKNTPVYEKLLEIKKNYSESEREYDRTWMENLQKFAANLHNADETVLGKIASGKIELIKE